MSNGRWDGLVSNRRQLLRVLGTGAIAGVAGCAGGNETSTEQGPSEPQAYRFYFDDEADTLGGAGDEDIPEDATDQQVVTNDRAEEEWEEMQLNDVEYARFAFNHRGIHNLTEGSVKQVEQKTIQLYQQRQNSNEFQDQHDAEIFTESVLDAVLEVTDASTGPAQANIVKTVADHIAHTNEQVDLQNYKLSEGLSMIGDAGGKRFSHQLGLLQYEENRETHVRYAEIENRYTDPHADPENSVYASDLDEGSFQTWQMGEVGTNDWVSVFDYGKWRELEEENVISDQSSTVFWALTHAVDDAALDGTDWDDRDVVGKDAEYSEEGIDAVVSDSFGESLEEYVKNPEEGDYTREEFETTARTVFTALETENFGGEFALDGDLATPEVYKAEEETLEEIRADMAYTDVASRVIS